MQINPSNQKKNPLEITHSNANASLTSQSSTETPAPQTKSAEISPLTQPTSAFDWQLIEPIAPSHQSPSQLEQEDWVFVDFSREELVANNQTRGQTSKNTEELPQLNSMAARLEPTQLEPTQLEPTQLEPSILDIPVSLQPSTQRQPTPNLISQWLPALSNENAQNILGGCFIMTVAALSAYGAAQGQSQGGSQNPAGFTLWRIN